MADEDLEHEIRKLRKAVDELAETIRDLRSAILNLPNQLRQG